MTIFTIFFPLQYILRSLIPNLPSSHIHTYFYIHIFTPSPLTHLTSVSPLSPFFMISLHYLLWTLSSLHIILTYLLPPLSFCSFHFIRFSPAPFTPLRSLCCSSPCSRAPCSSHSRPFPPLIPFNLSKGGWSNLECAGRREVD